MTTVLHTVAMAFGLCVVVPLHTAWAQGQKRTLDPLYTPALQVAKPHTAPILDIAKQGPALLAVGAYGVVLQQTGPAWQQSQVPVSVLLNAVAWASSTVVVAAGHDGVLLRSTDAGTSWQKVFDGNKANAAMVDWAKNRKAQLEQQGTKPDSVEFEEAELALDDALAGAEYGPSRPLMDVWFANAQHGYAVGSYGQAFKTTDQGKTWLPFVAHMPNPDARHLNAVTGTDTGQVWIVGEAGRVYFSNDAGLHFQRLDTPYSGQLYGFACISSNQQSNQNLWIAYGMKGHVFWRAGLAEQWQRLPLLGASNIDSNAAITAHASVGQQLWLANERGVLFRVVHSAAQGPMLEYVAHTTARGVTAMVPVLQGQALTGFWFASQQGPVWWKKEQQ